MRNSQNSAPRLLADIFRTVSVEQRGAMYSAYPSLKSARWILPSAPIHRRSGIAAYRPLHWSGRALKALVASGLLRGEPAPGATEPLERLRRFIGDKIDISDCALSLAVGTPGAYQKYALRIMCDDGTPIGYGKLADRESSKLKIVAEHAALTRLSSISALEGQVPKVLFFGEMDDCLMIVTTAGPDKPGPPAFSNLHVDFLRTLHSSSRVEKPLWMSDFWAIIRANLDYLSTRAPPSWLDRLSQARQLIESELQGRTATLSTIHRDFCPWNTCSFSDKLFVFDWEDSAAEAPPLHDVIHFHAIQHALAGRPFDLGVRIIETGAMELGVPLGGTVDAYALLLLYFLDIVSYYLRAAIERPQDGDSIVLTWAGRELDTRLGAFRSALHG